MKKTLMTALVIAGFIFLFPALVEPVGALLVFGYLVKSAL